ncbi:RHS repeat-associated core domain-containing protein [Flavobacterium sp. JP2137]|uniref:RHS repeat-associated core domain-containing protein n=1 Tax=Flavobacterium sp. JP2137 TaxID=3414510 RepID=UPI003D2FEBC9
MVFQLCKNRLRFLCILLLIFPKPTHYYEYLPFGELMVEQNLSTYYNNGYKFNAKELDVATGMYYYGARYYDPKTSLFLSVDPLAEKYPNWNPYAYTFNNPINFIDPTGMEGEGWIEHSTNKGEKMITYDAEINTKQEAKDKGYRNVETVSESLSYNGTSGFESYNLNKDGSVSDNLTGSTTDVGFSPMRTGDDYYISENNPLKSFASGLQSGGDALAYTGLGLSITGVGAPVGGAMIAIGGGMSLIGAGIEAGFMYDRGEKRNAALKLGMPLVFIGTGKLGIMAAEKAVGKGLSTGTETLINGINLTVEKQIGTEAEKRLKK